jgi:hypothetical protein
MSFLLALVLAAEPSVAIVSSSSDTAQLRFQPLHSKILAPEVARLKHEDGATVLGTLIPASRKVLVTAQIAPARDATFASELFLLQEKMEPISLAKNVAISTRAHVTPEGRIFIQRGKDNQLTIDEVNVTSKKLRPVFSGVGFTSFICGSVGRELIVYWVGENETKIVAVHIDTLNVRPLISIAPLAFDFVVDAPRNRMVFTLGKPGLEIYEVVSLDLKSGQLTSLATGDNVALIPTVFPDGTVAYAARQGAGLVDVKTKESVMQKNGIGFERVRFTADGNIVVLHEVPSEFSNVIIINKNKAVETLPTPPNARIDVAGVMK